MAKITPGIRNFIIANKIYFKDIVFNFGFTKGEIHGYVAEQIEWYNRVLHTKSEQSGDWSWQDIHKIMRNSKIRYEDVDIITDIIWNWKIYGVYIPNVTSSKKAVTKNVPIMKRELEL